MGVGGDVLLMLIHVEHSAHQSMYVKLIICIMAGLIYMDTHSGIPSIYHCAMKMIRGCGQPMQTSTFMGFLFSANGILFETARTTAGITELPDTGINLYIYW